jgi:hypothetical protein
MISYFLCHCYKESGRTKVLSELCVTEEKYRTLEPRGEESQRSCQRFPALSLRLARSFFQACAHGMLFYFAFHAISAFLQNKIFKHDLSCESFYKFNTTCLKL